MCPKAPGLRRGAVVTMAPPGNRGEESSHDFARPFRMGPWERKREREREREKGGKREKRQRDGGKERGWKRETHTNTHGVVSVWRTVGSERGGGVYVCACVGQYACVCVRVWVCVCMCVCVLA